MSNKLRRLRIVWRLEILSSTFSVWNTHYIICVGTFCSVSRSQRRVLRIGSVKGSELLLQKHPAHNSVYRSHCITSQRGASSERGVFWNGCCASRCWRVMSNMLVWRPTGPISTITSQYSTLIPKPTNVPFIRFHLLSPLWLSWKSSVSPSFSEENINIDRHTSVMSSVQWNRDSDLILEMCQTLFFSPLMSLLFFSDLNMRSNQLSFCYPPWSILMAAPPSARVLCLLLTGNAVLHRRTEREIFSFFVGKIQLSQPVMKEGYKHNLFVRTVCWLICVSVAPVLVLVTTEWENHALTFGLHGPKYCILMIFLEWTNNT